MCVRVFYGLCQNPLVYQEVLGNLEKDLSP